MDDNGALSVDRVAAQLSQLGLMPGRIVVVHTAFRRVRPIEGGPLGLINALRQTLGSAGTLVMPTMTDGTTVFDPRSTPTDGMGITAELFWRQPGVHRSTHPGGSFAAEGPLAEDICRPQPLSPPHGLDSPVGRVYEHDGYVLLLGVTHGENTTLHLAESMAPVPYIVDRPCIVDVDGQAQTMMIPETDHCCRGFGKMDDWLRAEGLQKEGKVGYADARLISSQDIVRVAVERIQADPLVFLCPADAGCAECDEARASCG